MKKLPLPYPGRFSVIEHAHMIIIICNVYTVEKWSVMSPPPSRILILNWIRKTALEVEKLNTYLYHIIDEFSHNTTPYVCFTTPLGPYVYFQPPLPCFYVIDTLYNRVPMLGKDRHFQHVD